MKKQLSTNVRESVMNQIKSGELHMRPRSYYSLLGLTAASVVALAGVTIAYLSSIVFFWARVATADTMAYGARANLMETVASFPWWALTLAAPLLAVAVVLVRKQGRMYKYKTSTLVLAIITCSLLLGLGLSFLSIGTAHTPNQGQGRQQNH